MRAFGALLLVGVALMLVTGCGPKTENIPPLETADVPPPPSDNGSVPKIRTADPIPTPGATNYTIQKGDTLYSLAKRFYGDGKLWTKIAEANKDKVKDISTIPVGTVLVIPAK
jgi:nucleoid-associated protein YgaU